MGESNRAERSVSEIPIALIRRLEWLAGWPWGQQGDGHWAALPIERRRRGRSHARRLYGDSAQSREPSASAAMPTRMTRPVSAAHSRCETVGMSPIRSMPGSERGLLGFSSDVYGASILGAPLRVWNPQPAGCPLLIAGIHGEEGNAVGVLSRAVRTLDYSDIGASLVLCANPDGNATGTRGNANGVDLNRNFPSLDWNPATVLHRWEGDHDPRVELSPGSSAGSEPEVRALIELVARLQPSIIIDFHSPLGEIIDISGSDLGRELSKSFGLPLHDPEDARGDWHGSGLFPRVRSDLRQRRASRRRIVRDEQAAAGNRQPRQSAPCWLSLLASLRRRRS